MGPTRKLIIERSYGSSLDGDAATPPLELCSKYMFCDFFV